MNLQVIGARVKEARTARDWSRSDLANAADLHFNTIRAVEYALASYGLETLAAIAQALGLTVGQLCDEAGSSEPPSAEAAETQK